MQAPSIKTVSRITLGLVATALFSLSGCVIAPEHGRDHDRYGHDRYYHEHHCDDGHDRDDCRRYR
ncbi:MAG: hypothetical protein ACREVV_20170 [Steroidobacteraceae bacterium]